MEVINALTWLDSTLCYPVNPVVSIHNTIVFVSDFAFSMCTHLRLHPCPRSSFSYRIPEGQVEAGSLAAGRLRSLEDQLTRAKQKIHSFQKLTPDGEFDGAGWWNSTGTDLGNMKGKKETTKTTKWITLVWAGDALHQLTMMASPGEQGEVGWEEGVGWAHVNEVVPTRGNKQKCKR